MRSPSISRRSNAEPSGTRSSAPNTGPKIAWTSRIKRDRDRPYAWTPGVITAQDDRGSVYVTRTADRSYIKVAGVRHDAQAELAAAREYA